MIRGPLRKDLIEAWEAAISEDYDNQRINSERSLQASFCSQLNKKFEAKSRRMFIEPPVMLVIDGETRKFSPDLVVCNSESVIAIVEMKYLPRTKPSTVKDMETLQHLSKHRDQITFFNSRFLGTGKTPQNFRLEDKVLFVWAGVHSSPEVSLTASADLDGCFLQLHAVTKVGECAEVRHDYS